MDSDMQPMNPFARHVTEQREESERRGEQPNRYVYRVDRLRLGVPAPANRPRCGYCNKPLPPIMIGPEVTHDDEKRVTTKTFTWSGHYDDRYGPFCRMRCAVWFAEAAYRRGYRIKR